MLLHLAAITSVVMVLRLTGASSATAPVAPGAPVVGMVKGVVRTADGAGLNTDCVVYLEPARSGPTTRPLRASGPPAVISQKGARFAPSLLVISVGQAVEFHNDEAERVEHNVFSRSSARPFDLGLFSPPEHRTVTFDKPGVVRLFCSIHRYMDGVIYVCPSPYFATVRADGSFEIGGVPAGEWTLRTWQRKARYPEAQLPVRVGGSGGTTTDVTLKRG